MSSLIEEAKGEHVPPRSVSASARRGLEMVKNGEAGDGLESATIARARRIADGAALTDDHVKRMHSFFERHDKTRPDDGGSGKSPWRTAWMLWGGNAGRRWAASVAKSLDESLWSLDIDDLVLVPDGDENDTLLLPAAAIETRNPEYDPLEEALAAKAVSEIKALIKKDFDKFHPRWPKGAPMGKGGEFMEIGQRFDLNGKTYEITAIHGSRVTAQIATGGTEVDEINLDATKTKDGDRAEINVEPAKTLVKGQGKKFSKTTPGQVIISPTVDSSTHDPSIPKPDGIEISDKEWQRFGREDQEHVTYLQERFGKWSPNKSKEIIAEIAKQYSSAARGVVHTAFDDQYSHGASYYKGRTLSLGKVFDAISDPDDPALPAAQKRYEEAKLLMRDIGEAIQWDIYNRAKAPDVLMVHRGENSPEALKVKYFEDDIPVIGAYAWSTVGTWSGSVSTFVPFAIRHLEMNTHSGGILIRHKGEYEGATSARIKFDPDQVYIENGNSIPAAVKKFFHEHMKTPGNPASGSRFYEGMAALNDPSVELELPPQPAELSLLPEEKTKIEVIPEDVGAAAVEMGMSAGYVGGSKDAAQQTLSEMDVAPGDFIEGMQGTRYVVVKNPGDSSKGLAYMKIGKALEDGTPDTFLPQPDPNKTWPFGASFDKPFRKLDAHIDLPEPKQDDFKPMSEADQSALSFSGEAVVVGKMVPSTLIKVDGSVYMVESADATKAIVSSVDDGKKYKINPVFKTEPLGMLGKPVELNANPGDHVVVIHEGVETVVEFQGKNVDDDGLPDGTLTVSLLNEDGTKKTITVDGANSHRIADSHYAPDGFEVGDQFSKDGKKWTVTSMLKDGTLRAKPTGGKVEKFPPPYSGVDDYSHLRISDWSIDEKVKAKELVVGDLVSGSKVKPRPYRVMQVSADKKTVTFQNLETGEIVVGTGNKSWPRLITKNTPDGSEIADPVPASPEKDVMVLEPWTWNTNTKGTKQLLTEYLAAADVGASLAVGDDKVVAFIKTDNGWEPSGPGAAADIIPEDKVVDVLVDTSITWHLSKKPEVATGEALMEDSIAKFKAAALDNLPDGAKILYDDASGTGSVVWTKGTLGVSVDADGYDGNAKPGDAVWIQNLTMLTSSEMHSLAKDAPNAKVYDGGGPLGAYADFAPLVQKEKVDPGAVWEPSVGSEVDATDYIVNIAPLGAVLKGSNGADYKKVDFDSWQSVAGNYTLTNSEMADGTAHEIVAWPAGWFGPEPGHELLPTDGVVDAAPLGTVLKSPNGPGIKAQDWEKVGPDAWTNGTKTIPNATMFDDDELHLVVNWPSEPKAATLEGPTPFIGEVLMATKDVIASAPVGTSLQTTDKEDAETWVKTDEMTWERVGTDEAITNEDMADGGAHIVTQWGGVPASANQPEVAVGTILKPESSVLDAIEPGTIIQTAGGKQFVKAKDGRWKEPVVGGEAKVLTTGELVKQVKTNFKVTGVIQIAKVAGDDEASDPIEPGNVVIADADVVASAPVGTILKVRTTKDGWSYQKVADDKWKVVYPPDNLAGDHTNALMADDKPHTVIQWGGEVFNAPEVETFTAQPYSDTGLPPLSKVELANKPVGAKVVDGSGVVWVKNDDSDDVDVFGLWDTDPTIDGNPVSGTYLSNAGPVYEFQPPVADLEAGTVVKLPDGSFYELVQPPQGDQAAVVKVIKDDANQPGNYLTVSAQQLDGAEKNDDVPGEGVTADQLPNAEQAGFKGFTYAKYGDTVNVPVGELVEGSTFVDKSKKTWLVKAGGAAPIVTDGFQNYSIDPQALVRSQNNSISVNGTESKGNKVGSIDDLTDAPIGTKVQFSSPLVADNAVWQKTGDDEWETDFGDGPVQASNEDMADGIGALSFLQTKAPFVDNSPSLDLGGIVGAPQFGDLTPFKYATWGDTKFDPVGEAAVGTIFADKTKTKFVVVAHIGDQTIYENIATGQQFTTSSENRVRTIAAPEEVSEAPVMFRGDGKAIRG